MQRKPREETTLAKAKLPTTVEDMEKAIKQHKDFMMTMGLHLQKTTTALKAGESLIRQGNIYANHVKEKMESLQAKSQQNLQTAQEWMERLQAHLTLQHFLQSCQELDGWAAEKEAMLMAGDETLQTRAPKRWLRHRAFMAELAHNKEWLRRIQKCRCRSG
uniref:Uncharacterized protein n=1 Tax=Sphaerodactylus townsendi TaxID=933632 RepID=A0ACB8FEN0_9SAUR